MSWQLASVPAARARRSPAASPGTSARIRPRACSRSSATLAALAVLGRIAFAPVPNVKPTTDIVLLSGFVLGGAPGFAVGAVAALASNLFFAQGPWTPWQMAAWGAVGDRGRGARARSAAAGSAAFRSRSRAGSRASPSA